MTFGNRLKRLRKQNHLTQSELGKQIGISNVTVSSIEVGSRQPSIDNIIKIAGYFNVSTDFLLGIQKDNILHSDGLTEDQKNIMNRLICSITRDAPK